MSEDVATIPDPPDDMPLSFQKWWSAKFKPYLTKAGRLPWALTNKDGAVAGDVGAPTLGAFSAHTGATSAHGASGDIIGTGNAAQAGTRGAVYQAAAVADPALSSTASAVAITTADPPNSYTDSNGDSVDLTALVALVLEQKADINTLVADLNAVRTDLVATRTQLIALLTALEGAGAVAP